MNIKKQCNKAGCKTLINTTERYCDKHKQHTNKLYEDIRTSTQEGKEYKQFYSSKAWRELRYQTLLDNGFICNICKVREATIGDHIIPTKVRWDLRLERKNVQGVCPECHNKKTEEDKKKYNL